MAKTDFLTADMTRRQFMKISGKKPCRAEPFRIHAVAVRLLAAAGRCRRSGDLGAAPGPAGRQRRPVHRLPALRDQLHPDQRRRLLFLHQPRQASSAASIWMAPATACSPARTTAGSTSRTPAASVRTLPAATPARRRPSPPTIRASASWIPTSASAAVPATRPAPGTCPPSTRRPASRPSASPAVPASQAARPALCPSWIGTPSPAQHRLPTWTCKEEKQWLNLMAGQASSCVSI